MALLIRKKHEKTENFDSKSNSPSTTTVFPTLSGGSISHKKKNITISINIPLNPMFYGHPEVSTPGSLHIQQHMHLEAPVTGFHHEDLAAVAWETRPEDS